MPKKFKVKFSKQVSRTIDDILKKGDKKAFDAIAGEIKKVQENPYYGIKIHTKEDKDVLEKLACFYGKKFSRICGWEGSVFGSGTDLEIELENCRIELYSTRIHTNHGKLNPNEVVMDKRLKSLSISSAKYERGAYVLEIESNKETYSFKAKGIAIDESKEN